MDSSWLYHSHVMIYNNCQCHLSRFSCSVFRGYSILDEIYRGCSHGMYERLALGSGEAANVKCTQNAEHQIDICHARRKTAVQTNSACRSSPYFVLYQLGIMEAYRNRVNLELILQWFCGEELQGHRYGPDLYFCVALCMIPWASSVTRTGRLISRAVMRKWAVLSTTYFERG